MWGFGCLRRRLDNLWRRQELRKATTALIRKVAVLMGEIGEVLEVSRVLMEEAEELMGETGELMDEFWSLVES